VIVFCWRKEGFFFLDKSVGRHLKSLEDFHCNINWLI
jgi:hypothetical protein